jgi:hypothetical protein
MLGYGRSLSTQMFVCSHLINAVPHDLTVRYVGVNKCKNLYTYEFRIFSCGTVFTPNLAKVSNDRICADEQEWVGFDSFRLPQVRLGDMHNLACSVASSPSHLIILSVRNAAASSCEKL